MPQFWRIYNDEIFKLANVSQVGVPSTHPSFIPNNYLDAGKFVVMRTCQGLGDWGIISAMPRLLKQKYPNCKVYLPSSNLISRLFRTRKKWMGSWTHWPDPEKMVEIVFENNPHVDGYLDTISDDVFHDHWRIVDIENLEIPLIEQMLEFWQFEEDEYKDSAPELFWSNEETQLGDSIIKEYFGDEEFGGLIFNTSELEYGQFYKKDINERIIKVLNEFGKSYNYVHYSGVDIKETPFKDHVNVKLDFKDTDISIRVQLYIRSKAKFNIGYQSSIYDVLPRYTKIICVPNYCSDYDSSDNLRENFSRSIEYLR